MEQKLQSKLYEGDNVTTALDHEHVSEPHAGRQGTPEPHYSPQQRSW